MTAFIVIASCPFVDCSTYLIWSVEGGQTNSIELFFILTSLTLSLIWFEVEACGVFGSEPQLHYPHCKHTRQKVPSCKEQLQIIRPQFRDKMNITRWLKLICVSKSLIYLKISIYYSVILKIIWYVYRLIENQLECFFNEKIRM